ncbi:MAG: hypothetical protein DMG21_08870 [Acidobacteria bacterium]|nr:MAG: hypothetical protein DMG21_08870 [Acidobacteriota bacterium]
MRPAAAFVKQKAASGAGVVWHGFPFETPFIPAEAGIHFASLWKSTVDGLDSRLRGNDCASERPLRHQPIGTSLAAEYQQANSWRISHFRHFRANSL